MKNKANAITPEETTQLLASLQDRFEHNKTRHPEMLWEAVQAKLEANPEKMWSLYQMEATGGEPDVVAHNKEDDLYTFFDCSPESPALRRSFCYDNEALEARKKDKPKDSAIHAAQAMGISILTEEEYRYLQQLGEFDRKTSSWVLTPKEIRILGGALFCDRRYNCVFVYHNGVESYYAARGFRGSLQV